MAIITSFSGLFVVSLSFIFTLVFNYRYLYFSSSVSFYVLFIREANIEITLGHNLAVFTRSAITPPKVNWIWMKYGALSRLLWAGRGRFWARSAQ